MSKQVTPSAPPKNVPTEDHLKEDPPVYGQDWCVVSMIAPVSMVGKKNLHYVNRFMVADINKTITAQAIQMAKLLAAESHKKIEDVLNRLKCSVDEDDKRVYTIINQKFKEITVDEDEFVGECRRQYELDEEEIMDRFKMYLAENRLMLDREFDEAHDHVPSVYGIKLRGSYQRFEDAKARANFVRDNVESGIHAFVAPVGKWLPVDFEADEVEGQEYMLPQLNDLMKKYHENIHARNAHYQERRRDMEEDAANGNKKTTKDKLQEKLRERRNAKMRKELESVQEAGAEEEETTPSKSKQKSKPTSADSIGAELVAELAETKTKIKKSKKKSSLGWKHASTAQEFSN